MKTCQYCEESMKKQNFNKHKASCFVKNTFGANKSDIIRLLEQNNIGIVEKEAKNDKDYLNLKARNEINEMLLEKAFKFIKSFSDEAIALSTERNGVNPEDPLDKISHMMVAESTKQEYISDWKQYSKYCEGKKMNPFISDYANSYLESCKNTLSTIIRKKGNLQSILSYVLNSRVLLRKIRKKPVFTPKYALTQSEIHAYLKEQRKISEDDFLLQKLLIDYGCRINTAGSIKVKHLEFLNGDNIIILPDQKTGARSEPITDDLRHLLGEHVRRNNLEHEDFLFKIGCNNNNERKRTSRIGLRINKRIENSEAMKKSKNFKYSSHMFRKTKAFNIFNEIVKTAKAAARIGIGQKKESGAIEHYIHM